MTAREVLDRIKAQHSGHVKCLECGKCRVSRQEWCLVCDYWACEDDTACKDNPAPGNIARLTNALEAVLAECDYLDTLADGDKHYAAGFRKLIEKALNP